MTPGPRYPDFLCIGGRKAGTTWLHHNLIRHPLVFAPPVKEVHYFDTLYFEDARDHHRRAAREAAMRNERLAAAPVGWALRRLRTALGLRSRTSEKRAFKIANAGVEPDDAWYGQLFRDAAPEQIACDFTPDYAPLPRAGVEHARRLNPDIRALFILRNPVERAYSHAKWIAARRNRPCTEADLLRILERPAVRRCDSANAAISLWTEVLGTGRVRVVFFDDIASRPLDLLAEVCAFAGLPFDRARFGDAGRPVNAGPPVPMPPAIRARLEQTYASEIAALAERYPERVSGWLNGGSG